MIALRHEVAVACVDLSADGAFAVTTDKNQIVHVWRLANGNTPIRSFKLAGAGFLNAAAISHDGALVGLAPMGGANDYASCATPSEVRIVAVAGGEVVRVIPVAGRAQALRFLPDGSLVVGSCKSGVHVFSPEGRETETLGTKTLSVEWFAGSPSRLIGLERVAHWRMLTRGAKPKAEAVKVSLADCTEDVLVTGDGRDLTMKRGKSTVTVPLPASAKALVIDPMGERVLVLTDSAMHTFALADLAPGVVINGNFGDVRRARCVAGRVILCGYPTISSAPRAALVVELPEARTTTTNAPIALAPMQDTGGPAHTTRVVTARFADERRLVTVDTRGQSIVWEGEAEAPLTPRSPRPDEDIASPRTSYLIDPNLGGADSPDGAFFLKLAYGHLTFYLTAWPSAFEGRWASDVRAVDAAVASDHRVVIATQAPDLRVVDLVTNKTLSITPLPATPCRIALHASDAALSVGVAYADGTVARFALPAHAPVASPAEHIRAMFETPLARPVWDELSRLDVLVGFGRGAKIEPEPTSLPTPRGDYPLPKYLRQLFAVLCGVGIARHVSEEWDELREVYKRIWTELKTPQAERVIDFRDLCFAREPRILGASGSLPVIELATMGDTGVSWGIVAGAIAPSGDPTVHLVCERANVLESMISLSYFLTMLVPGFDGKEEDADLDPETRELVEAGGFSSHPRHG